MRIKRTCVDSAEKLIAWRESFGLSQRDAAPIFCRKRRAYQDLEAGKHRRWGFPSDIDLLASLYEIRHKRKRKKS